MTTELETIRSAAVSIIHDLRNPLAAIRASSEVLIRGGLSECQVRRIARNVHGASVRIEELVGEFLGQCRGANRHRELCEIHELIVDAVERIAERAESQSVEIVREVPEGLHISVDRLRIHRVLVNLLVNALEAMPIGGSIRIFAMSEPGAVLIHIRDTGPGLAPEICERLFEPYATVGKPGGIGLGLAFSRQTVIEHGGTIWAEACLQGACFVIRLPAIPVTATASC
jgi:signal transduction histidine kinase